MAVILERRHTMKEVTSALAEVLRMPPSSLAPVDDPCSLHAPIAIQLDDLAPGEFSHQLTVYTKELVHARRSDLDLAIALAPKLRERVLASPAAGSEPYDTNPFAWLLVTPEGAVYFAFSVPEKEPGIVLDLANIQPWHAAPAEGA